MLYSIYISLFEISLSPTQLRPTFGKIWAERIYNDLYINMNLVSFISNFKINNASERHF